MKQQTEQERLGISDETMNSMKRFFLKHSVPVLIARKREEEKNNGKPKSNCQNEEGGS